MGVWCVLLLLFVLRSVSMVRLCDMVKGSFQLVCADGSEHSFGFTVLSDTDFGRECRFWCLHWILNGGCVYCSMIASDGSYLGSWGH